MDSFGNFGTKTVFRRNEACTYVAVKILQIDNDLSARWSWGYIAFAVERISIPNGK